MIARPILLSVCALVLAGVCSAQSRYAARDFSAFRGSILPLNGVNFPRTDSGLQAALNALGNSCGAVVLPPNLTIDISIEITIPSCSGGQNVLSGSGDTTVLNFTNTSARIVQSSGTTVRNLRIDSTQTNSVTGGEVFSEGTSDVEASNLTFSGGGSHITYRTVSHFTISGTRHLSLTAKGNAILLQGSDHGAVIDAHVEGFTAPASDSYYGGAIRVGNGSSRVNIVNPSISNIDATTVRNYAGVDISASHNVSVLDGLISGLKNGDGVVTEDGATDVNISGTVSTGNSNSPGAGSYGNNGDGFDIYNSARVRLSNCVGDNNGHLSSNLQRGAEIFTSEDVTVSNCDFSNNSAEGVIVVGSPRTQLTEVTANGNRMAGVYFLQASGNVLVSGRDVTFAGGVGFGWAWQPGTEIKIQSVRYTIASVTDGSHLTLSQPPASVSSATYSVDSYEAQLSSGTFNNNGSDGTMTNGIYLADSTTASISSVTATDDRANSKTQMWGANIQNQARAVFFHDDFRGNAAGEIQDAPGQSEEYDMVHSTGSEPPCCKTPRPIRPIE